jgi:Protein of unknown function (DUF4239)
MARTLIHLNLWALGGLLVVVIPLAVVAVQATIRRLAPSIVSGEHNDVAGFLIAVVGVVYAVTLAFIVIVTWEEFRNARDTVEAEAGALRVLYRDTRPLPEPIATQSRQLVLRYAEEVSTTEWHAMDNGHSSATSFELIGDLFSTLEQARDLTPTQQTFLSNALDRLNEVALRRAQRLGASEQSTPPVLWAAIIVGGIVTLGFALIFGVSNEQLHYLMVGGFAAVLALQVFVILVLSHPFSGQIRVEPTAFEQVARDFH